LEFRLIRPARFPKPGRSLFSERNLAGLYSTILHFSFTTSQSNFSTAALAFLESDSVFSGLKSKLVIAFTKTATLFGGIIFE
jgi:hypothetical protein